MYILKNAVLNIRSSAGRNILIGVIVFVIAVSSCIALSVKQASKKAEETELDKLTVTATISADREKMMQNAKDGATDFKQQMQNMQELSLEEMQTYADASSVKDFVYTMTSTVNASGLEPVDTSSDSSSSDTEDTQSMMPEGGQGMQPGDIGGQKGGMTVGDFQVTGYSSSDAMTEFSSSVNTLDEGELFAMDGSENECIISSELAAYNALSVGDTIQLVNPNLETQTYSFVVTGLYTYTSTDSSGGMQFSSSMSAANQIYTSYPALEAVIAATEANATTSTDDSGRETSTALTGRTNGTYIFASADDYEAFTEEAASLGLSEDFKISSVDLEIYEASVEPLKNTAKFATTLLWIVLIIGGIILAVLNIFNIRERKYEVGVLTAIGMKKKKVALQFVAELFLVTFTAVLLGTAAGAAASVPVANTLLESQLATQKETSSSGPDAMPQGMDGGRSGKMPGMPGQSSTPIEYIQTIQASVDFSVILKLVSIGVLLAVLASLSAVIFIMRYEPLKILSERA